jgi:hypothetical protein
MQRVWARILADEVKAPGSYRLRTLDFLRSLAKADAEKIAAIGPFALDYMWMFRDEYLKSKGLQFQNMLELQEMGILSGVEAEGLVQEIYSVRDNEFVAATASNGKALLYRHENKTRQLRFDSYRVTALGAEVLRLGDYPADDEYLKRIAASAKGQGFKVSYGTWVVNPKNRTEGRIRDATDL